MMYDLEERTFEFAATVSNLQLVWNFEFEGFEFISNFEFDLPIGSEIYPMPPTTIGGSWELGKFDFVS